MFEPDSSLSTALNTLALLAEQCAMVVRLQNDLRTYQRERAEGVINAVALQAQEILAAGYTSDKSKAEVEAVTTVGKRLLNEQLAMRELAQQIHTATHIERRFVRGTDFTVAMYLAGDLRNWAEDIEHHVEA
jgi:hypothetical protein